MYIIHFSFLSQLMFFLHLVNGKLLQNQRKIEMNYIWFNYSSQFADKKNNNLLENILHFIELEIISNLFLKICLYSFMSFMFQVQ